MYWMCGILIFVLGFISGMVCVMWNIGGEGNMSKGALLNYTTGIAVEKTIGEIYQILARNKTSAIMSEYDGAGNIIAIAFKAQTEFGIMAFRLPANPQAASKALNNQVEKRLIPRRYFNDVTQARRGGATSGWNDTQYKARMIWNLRTETPKPTL